LKCIELDSFCFNEPTAGLDAVIAFQPCDIRRDAPVWILAQSWTTNAKVIISARGPVLQCHEQTVVLVHIDKAELVERICSRLVLILLARIDAGTARISGANVEYETRSERVCPRAAVVSSFTAAGSRSFSSDRIENGNVLLRVAEENDVAIAEVMIDPHLETV
jgi:hypothetical protein